MRQEWNQYPRAHLCNQERGIIWLFTQGVCAITPWRSWRNPRWVNRESRVVRSKAYLRLYFTDFSFYGLPFFGTYIVLGQKPELQ